ncbi:NAD(P)/FAD-dependent oxidoreductase [Chitinilyticum piscinae]|uniref:FAD-dependent oxidoreductase n=1 Tax=Chitinilyticum piscinae TaxID=2866724 RepID=A0A8J7FX86_9NEIS|nr:FAD-dependent oxidoreductase [Chitinilyticum piscinae]MBE9608330.1 FAD-dependent oxidoreductase [Chitinilyticum piscinae]
MDEQWDVVVIGAGMAGVTYARTVHDAGMRVLLLERARGVGGRMATRRSGTAAWDHGAQYFTVTHPDFHTLVTDWVDDGLAAIWPGRICSWDGEALRSSSPAIRYVGVPGMTALCKAMCAPLPHLLHCEVGSLEHDQAGWRIRGETRSWRAQRVVLAMPPQQAAALLPQAHALQRAVQLAEMLPTWSVLLRFAAALPLPAEGMFVNHEPLSWVANNSSKPGRPEGHDWVVHASSVWSAAHRDLPPGEVCEVLELALLDLCRQLAPAAEMPALLERHAHLWRHARPAQASQRAYLEGEDGLAVIGDWLQGGRVEGAFRSGVALARHHCGLIEDLIEPADSLNIGK